MTSTLSPVEQWTNEHLFLIASQRDWDKVPPLSLKDGDVMVQLVQKPVKDETELLVEKRYTGRLKRFAQRELDSFNKVNYKGMERFDLLRSYEKGTLLPDPIVRTKWCGLDTNNWAQLLKVNRGRNGVEQPQHCFTKEAAAILAWVRGVLRSMQNFHEDGFVHCDLLSRNIVIPCTAVEGNNFQFILDLDNPNIIDLELCLSPKEFNSAKWGEPFGRNGFFDNNNKPLSLNPEDRSEYLCPGPIKKPELDELDTVSRHWKDKNNKDFYYQGRNYKYDNTGNRIFHENPFSNLTKVDWGVDLFSLGVSVREMIRDNDLQGEEKVLDYLDKLPKILRGFEALCGDNDKNPRPTPHAKLIKEIDNLIGVDAYKKYRVTVPSEAYKIFVPIEEKPSYELVSEPKSKPKPKPKSETLQSSPPPPPPPPPPKSTPWNTKRLTTGAIMLLGMAGGGAWWAGQGKKTPPAPMKVVEEVKPTPTPAPPPPPTAAELYQQATSRMQQTAWYKGEAKPTDTDLQWVRETQRLAADNVVDAQFQHALLSCRGIASPAIAHDTQQCGKWLAQVLVATPPVHADQENNRRDAAINYFSSLVWNSDPYLPDSHFARSLQPGLVAWKEHSPTLKMALAYTVACYQQPADGEKARQMVAEVITQNPNKDMLKLAKNIQTLLQNGKPFPCP
ncbi:MAG: hypothetical protein RIR79_715 [Pseudomonadota bacterium]|jgi:hypothetical protein